MNSKKVVLTLVLIVGLCMVSYDSFAIVMHDGAVSDPSWQQEYLELGASYDSVVGVYVYRDGWGFSGSGTIFGDGSDVIGAAHVALDSNGYTYDRYAIVTGANLFTGHTGIYYTSKVHVHPNYTGTHSTDLAVWNLNETIADITPATLNTGSDWEQLDTWITTVGYGNTGYASTGEKEIDGNKRGCVNILADIRGDELIQYFAPPIDFHDYNHLGGHTGAGDSGGGYFLYGTNTLSGVHSGLKGFGGYGAGFYGTSISQNIDWIRGATVPAPSTILLLGSGLLFLFRFRNRD